jgi:[acyl-carrier-protein] S-malonyltransferase
MNRFAMIFPGQGSQSVGMMQEMAAAFPVVIETFQEASNVLGYDLWSLVQDGPEERLNQTDHTQPAMLAAGVASWHAWRQNNGPMPAIMAGHSLGEYTALVCAGAISLQDGIALVADRGRFMQEAVPAGEGAMAAILGLDDDEVRSICEQASKDGIAEAVNFNSPGQVVIAGRKPAIDSAIELAKDSGAKRALLLPVSVPSHCALMHPAAERLAARLNDLELAIPEIPVIHNVDVASHADIDDIKHALSSQLYKPVRWVETIQHMIRQDITTIIECGPGKVLTGLNKRISRDLVSIAVYNLESLHDAIAQTS